MSLDSDEAGNARIFKGWTLVQCGHGNVSPQTDALLICHALGPIHTFPHPHLPVDQTDVLQHTVNALGSLLGHPAILAQLQLASAAPVVEPGQDDAAMLQLEALHALLLILPLPEVG